MLRDALVAIKSSPKAMIHLLLLERNGIVLAILNDFKMREPSTKKFNK